MIVRDTNQRMIKYTVVKGMMDEKGRDQIMFIMKTISLDRARLNGTFSSLLSNDIYDMLAT